MKRFILSAALAVVLLQSSILRSDDQSDRIKAQKETANENWKRLFGDLTATQEETNHFLIYGPANISPKQINDLGKSLEDQYATARKALNSEPTDEFWMGKLTVYLFDEKRNFHSFLRTVAKRRPDAGDLGVFSLQGVNPFVAAGPPQSKSDPSIEAQAGEQVSAAVLSKLVGSSVPDWVSAGFGRATAWHAAPNAKGTRDDRNQAKRLITRFSAKDVWTGNVKADEAPILQGSLVDFMAYGPQARSFLKFLDGFKPEENQEQKTTMDALKTAKIQAGYLDRAWRSWAANGGR